MARDAARARHTRGSCLRRFPPSENVRKRLFCSLHDPRRPIFSRFTRSSSSFPTFPSPSNTCHACYFGWALWVFFAFAFSWNNWLNQAMPETIQFLGFPIEKCTLYKLLKLQLSTNGGCCAWIFLLYTFSPLVCNEILNIMFLKLLEVTQYRLIFKQNHDTRY